MGNGYTRITWMNEQIKWKMRYQGISSCIIYNVWLIDFIIKNSKNYTKIHYFVVHGLYKFQTFSWKLVHIIGDYIRLVVLVILGLIMLMYM